MNKFHGILTKYVVEESGDFRRGEEGVYNGDECIFMASPAQWNPIFEYIPIESQIDKILDDVPYTSNTLMDKLGLKSKEGFRRNYFRPAIDGNLIRMTIPDKPNSRNQRYVKG